MTNEEKTNLVILLNEYKADILKKRKKTREIWNGDKALFNHIRILERKLSKEIEAKMYHGL